MAVLTVDVPDALKAWVEREARSGRFLDASDFLRDLLRREKERREKIAAMQTLVDEARASGIGTMTIEELLALAGDQASSL